jgi:CheY-like chemotaxis protein
MTARASSDTLRVLLADRRGWIARAILNVLDPDEWSAVHCYEARELLRTLPRFLPHAIVLNDDLEDIRTDDLLPMLRRDPAVGLITPIVIVSTRALRQRRLETLRAGATEHFLFPAEPEAFVLRLRALATARREVEQLTRAVLLDVETGLYNAVGLERRGREIASDARRRHEPVSCVVFASVPASESVPTDHPVPLPTASELGGRMREAARFSDAVGRVEETLVVIAPATGQTGAQRLAERLQRALRSGEGAGASSAPQVRAAYCAVADFSRATLGVPEMIDRARRTLAATDAADAPAIVGESLPLSTA